VSLALLSMKCYLSKTYLCSTKAVVAFAAISVAHCYISKIRTNIISSWIE
jgi:hypothetical protein